MTDTFTLQELLDALTFGTGCHIGVSFLPSVEDDRMHLRWDNIIHGAPFCYAMKSREGGAARCLACRAMADRKTMQGSEPFDGYCIHGIYEYWHPIYKDGKLFCVIYVGNIVGDPALLLRRSKLAPDDPLLDTLETRMTPEDCARVARIVAAYIHTYRKTVEKAPAVISAICSYVEEFYSQDISLCTLAKLYGYNEKYLDRLFLRHMGVSFGDYLNRRRLQEAQERLRSTSESILEVASAVGFSSVTYFNRLFRSATGMTPTAFRKSGR